MTRRLLASASICLSLIAAGDRLEDKIELPHINARHSAMQIFNGWEYASILGGVNEQYLNNSGFHHRRSESVEYYSLVDEFERQIVWLPLKTGEASISRFATRLSYLMNLQAIKSSEEMALISLLEQTDKISEHARVEQIYNAFRARFTPHGQTKSGGSIVSLLDGEPGDCNDVVAALAALYKHYDIDADLEFGSANDGVDVTLHAWLSIDTPRGKIDLDPTWYPYFAPLEKRIKR